jgi:tetratricopeptide (TPR) repeat protein
MVSRTNGERGDFLEVIDVIESIMKDEDFSLEKESSLKINKILSFLDNELSEDRSFNEVWLIKGTVLYKAGKHKSAIEAFDEVLKNISQEITKESMTLWKNKNRINCIYASKFKALSLMKLGRYKEGLGILNKILEVFPTDSDIQEYRTILYIFEDQNLFRKLNEIPYNYPKTSINWEDRGRSLYELDEYEEALQIFSKILEINPLDANVWGYKGSALYILDRYEEALEAFEKSLKINSKNASIWSFKGSALYMLNRLEEALKAFDKALQKGPNIIEAWFNKGAVLFGLGRYKQALSAVENALRINSKSVNALNLKSSILDELAKEK